MLLLALVVAWPALRAGAVRERSLRDSRAPNAGAGLPGGLQNDSMPSWYYKDGKCADSPHGWADSKGNTCQDYEQNFYCTKTGAFGAGWWPVWGSFSNYATQNRTAATACCVCGGGAPSCCPARGKLEAVIAGKLTPLQSYAQKLAGQAAAEVNSAGAAEASKLQSLLAQMVPNVSSEIINASAHQRTQMLALARERFDNETAGYHNLTEAVKEELVDASYHAVRGAVDHSSQQAQTRLTQAVQKAGKAIHTAAVKWEEAFRAGKEAAKLGAEVVTKYFADADATAAAVQSSMKNASLFLEATERAQKQARLSQQATAVMTDASEAVRVQAQAVDAQVRTATARAQSALRATSANSGKLDNLEAMVDAAEKAAAEVSRQLR